MTRVRDRVSGEEGEFIHLKIRKDDLEAFSSASGLFKMSFLQTLKKSEKDLTEGRITKRRSLDELTSQ
jgi:hypothetical protein